MRFKCIKEINNWIHVETLFYICLIFFFSNLGSSDFFGLNHYTTVWVLPDTSPDYVLFCGAKIKTEVDPSWPKTCLKYFSVSRWQKEYSLWYTTF